MNVVAIVVDIRLEYRFMFFVRVINFIGLNELIKFTILSIIIRLSKVIELIIVQLVCFINCVVFGFNWGFYPYTLFRSLFRFISLFRFRC